MELSRAAVPTGWLLREGGHGGRGNHDHDSRTDVTPCITIRVVCNITFCTARSPLRRLMLTEERDLGPFVSV
jgi:hypothetical protein